MEEYAGGCAWLITDYMSRIELMILTISDKVELFNCHVRYIATKLRTLKAEVNPVFERSSLVGHEHKTHILLLLLLVSSSLLKRGRDHWKEGRPPWKYNRRSRHVLPRRMKIFEERISPQSHHLSSRCHGTIRMWRSIDPPPCFRSTFVIRVYIADFRSLKDTISKV